MSGEWPRRSLAETSPKPHRNVAETLPKPRGSLANTYSLAEAAPKPL